MNLSRLTLGLFCAGLLLCLLLDASILYALAFGLLLFLCYGRHKGFSWKALFQMTLEGIGTIHNILITFILIGILTAFWRAAGTIPAIICYVSGFIRPSVFLLMCFLLNCGVSVLTGTSFGTAATMGVICASMGAVMGVDIRLIGGAVLSGAFFGDRWSPVSTSALLVAELTGTDIYHNLRRMLRTSLVPFGLSCLIYLAAGLFSPRSGAMPDLYELFGREYAIHPAALIPAVLILVLSALRMDVKLAMTASILSAVPLCLFLQHIQPAELLRAAFLGCRVKDPVVAPMMNGGGIISMLKVIGIVCLSTSYSGIFQKTGLLEGEKHAIESLAKKTSSFAAMLATSILTGMVTCNQTLTVILADQLCAGLRKDASDFALDLEDSAIVVVPLVPWSISSGVPLASIGAPLSAIPFSFFLYLLPLWRLVSGKGRAVPNQ